MYRISTKKLVIGVSVLIGAVVVVWLFFVARSFVNIEPERGKGDEAERTVSEKAITLQYFGATEATLIDEAVGANISPPVFINAEYVLTDTGGEPIRFPDTNVTVRARHENESNFSPLDTESVPPFTGFEHLVVNEGVTEEEIAEELEAPRPRAGKTIVRWRVMPPMERGKYILQAEDSSGTLYEGEFFWSGVSSLQDVSSYEMNTINGEVVVSLEMFDFSGVEEFYYVDPDGEFINHKKGEYPAADFTIPVEHRKAGTHTFLIYQPVDSSNEEMANWWRLKIDFPNN